MSYEPSFDELFSPKQSNIFVLGDGLFGLYVGTIL